jgi:hypothetical protein
MPAIGSAVRGETSLVLQSKIVPVVPWHEEVAAVFAVFRHRG